MKSAVKALLIWFLVLATPLQGFAATTMLLCKSSRQPMALPVVQQDIHAAHHHDDMDADPGVRHDASSLDHGKHHGAAKCNACSACCMLVAMAMPDPISATLAVGHSQAIPFFAGAVRVFVPESLDPPPRRFSA